jgi:catechol-2,3-dioxygenase
MVRSLPFYRALLAHLGATNEGSIVGEHGEVVVYLNGPGGAVGLREASSAGAVDRYAPGLHHLAFDAPSREVVDAIAAWLRDASSSRSSTSLRGALRRRDRVALARPVARLAGGQREALDQLVAQVLGLDDRIDHEL